MSLSLPNPSQPRRSKTILSPDGQTAKFLYTILKQLDLKTIDWNDVARQLDITNGHAARMRYSRFRSQIEGLVKEPKAKPKHTDGKDGTTSLKDKIVEDDSSKKRKMDIADDHHQDGFISDALKKVKLEHTNFNRNGAMMVKQEYSNPNNNQHPIKSDPGAIPAQQPRVHHPVVTTYSLPVPGTPKVEASSRPAKVRRSSKPKPKPRQSPFVIQQDTSDPFFDSPNGLVSASPAFPHYQLSMPPSKSYPSPPNRRQYRQPNSHMYPAPGLVYPSHSPVPSPTPAYRYAPHQYQNFQQSAPFLYPQEVYEMPNSNSNAALPGWPASPQSLQAPPPTQTPASAAHQGFKPVSQPHCGTYDSDFTALLENPDVVVPPELDQTLEVTGNFKDDLDWLYTGLGSDFNAWARGESNFSTTDTKMAATSIDVADKSAVVSNSTDTNTCNKTTEQTGLDCGTEEDFISNWSSVKDAAQVQALPLPEVPTTVPGPGSSVADPVLVLTPPTTKSATKTSPPALTSTHNIGSEPASLPATISSQPLTILTASGNDIATAQSLLSNTTHNEITPPDPTPLQSVQPGVPHQDIHDLGVTSEKTTTDNTNVSNTNTSDKIDEQEPAVLVKAEASDVMEIL